MDRQLNLVAFDCGNSSIRTILCHFDGTRIVSEPVLQEANRIIEEDGLYYWDMDEIFRIMKKGLAMAAEKVDRVDSVGVCTWGIDFMLLDEKENFIQKALCYRNTIGAESMESLTDQEKREMFYRTGILCDKINSIYMLKGIWKYMPDAVPKTKKLLLVPDVFVYMFTGVLCNEPSELSTSQMMDVKNMQISKEQCDFAGVSPSIFSKIGEHGKPVGNIRKEVLEEIGVDYDIPFICVPSHDTACAVHAIPCKDENYLFVSSGTWSLIGAQIDKPIINDQILQADLTNEVGAFGKTTLLRNSAGMFLTQRLKDEYEKETGQAIGWGEFTALADRFEGKAPVFDVNDIKFFNPKSMAEAIWETIHPEKKRDGADWEELLASTYRSLGHSFAKVSKMVMDCTGRAYDKVYVVGGGCRNEMIIHTFADEIGLPILTCDMECSSIGNAASQIAFFHPEYSYAAIREIITDSLPVKIYQPEKRG